MKKTRKNIIENRIMRAVLCIFCTVCIICAGCSGGTNDDTTGSDDSTTTSGDNNGGSTGGSGGSTETELKLDLHCFTKLEDNNGGSTGGSGGSTETELKLDLHCFTKLEDGTVLFSENDTDYDYTIETAAKAQSKFTKAAQKYIKRKFANLQEQMQKENPTENTFKTVLNDAINLTDRQGETHATPFDLADMLDRGIPAFYGETAKYIAQIINNLDGNDQAKFRACYDHLAVQAYEKSLTVTNDPTLVTLNRDKPKIANELDGLKIKEVDTEKTLMALLKQVAGKQNIKAETLKDSVNLALDIDGLYGLHDSVYIQGTVPAWTFGNYEGWNDIGGIKNAMPPRARNTYDPSKYDLQMSKKPMFGDLLNEELRKLQQQTQSYEMGR